MNNKQKNKKRFWFRKPKFKTLGEQKKVLNRNKKVIYISLALWVVLALVVLLTTNQVAINVLNVICFGLLLTIFVLVVKNLILVWKMKRRERKDDN